MAGHSKWHNIQHRKNAQDAKRGKIFTKLIREITTAAKMGGPDADSNPRLRTAIDKALQANMTRDTIDRAVKRGSGSAETESYEEVRYEGYGIGGVAVMVDCLTDNRNRTVSEVRHAFSKHGGNLGTDGSVAYLFTATGVLSYPPESDEDAIMEAALEAGAQDVEAQEDGSIEVLTAFEDFLGVKDAMAAVGFVPVASEVVQRAATMAEIADLDHATSLMKMIDRLEDLDDVQAVHTNADISDEIAEQLG